MAVVVVLLLPFSLLYHTDSSREKSNVHLPHLLSFKIKLPNPVACCMFEAIISCRCLLLRCNTATTMSLCFIFFCVCVIAPIPVFHATTHTFVVIRSINTACKTSGLGLCS